MPPSPTLATFDSESLGLHKNTEMLVWEGLSGSQEKQSREGEKVAKGAISGKVPASAGNSGMLILPGG
jgi:hypothetical protein